MSSRGVPRFGEGPLQGPYAVEDGITFAPAIMAIGEPLGIVEGESLAKLGETHRLGVEQVDGQARHQPPPVTRSTKLASAVSPRLPLARRSRKRGRPSRSVWSSFGGALWSGSSSRIG